MFKGSIQWATSRPQAYSESPPRSFSIMHHRSIKLDPMPCTGVTSLVLTYVFEEKITVFFGRAQNW